MKIMNTHNAPIETARFTCKVTNTTHHFENVEDMPMERYMVEQVIIIDEAEFAKFQDNMMDAYEFLSGKGGTDTTTMPASAEHKEHLYELTEDEMTELRRGAYRKCVALTTPKGDHKYVIDPQGYDYARYVAIIH